MYWYCVIPVGQASLLPLLRPLAPLLPGPRAGVSVIQRAPPPRETPPPYKEPPHIILERRAEMAEVTPGSLAQGEQKILLLYD